jgi:hypothetical protein
MRWVWHVAQQKEMINVILKTWSHQAESESSKPFVKQKVSMLNVNDSSKAQDDRHTASSNTHT